jgi:hypothetical protein
MHNIDFNNLTNTQILIGVFMAVFLLIIFMKLSEPDYNDKNSLYYNNGPTKRPGK